MVVPVAKRDPRVGSFLLFQFQNPVEKNQFLEVYEAVGDNPSLTSTRDGSKSGEKSEKGIQRGRRMPFASARESVRTIPGSQTNDSLYGIMTWTSFEQSPESVSHT